MVTYHFIRIMVNKHLCSFTKDKVPNKRKQKKCSSQNRNVSMRLTSAFCIFRWNEQLHVSAQWGWLWRYGRWWYGHGWWHVQQCHGKSKLHTFLSILQTTDAALIYNSHLKYHHRYILDKELLWLTTPPFVIILVPSQCILSVCIKAFNMEFTLFCF